MITRECTKCNTELPVTSEYFYRKEKGKYGFNAECKKCNDLRRKGMLELLPRAKNGYKICRKCNSELPATLEHFYKKDTTIDGLRNQCKKCEVKQSVAHYKTPHGKMIKKKYASKFYKKHKDEILDKSRIYYENNKDHIATLNKNYRKTPAGRRARRKEYAHRKNMDSEELFDNAFSEKVKVHWHHINNKYIVAIPSDLHLLYGGKNIERHRWFCIQIINQIYNMEEIEIE